MMFKRLRPSGELGVELTGLLVLGLSVVGLVVLGLRLPSLLVIVDKDARTSISWTDNCPAKAMSLKAGETFDSASHILVLNGREG
jgi:hypothetical protein